MRGIWALLAIESRKNPGLFMFPVLVVASWLVTTRFALDGLVLWTQSGHSIRNIVLFLGPLSAGLAAWMAGRSRWRRTEELLSTTSLSSMKRNLTTWAATTIWGLLAYLVVVFVIAALTYRGATWGSPPFTLILNGLLAATAYSAIGFAFGYYVRNRLLVPLIPIALYIAQGMPIYFQNSIQNLTPVDLGGAPSVFYQTDFRPAVFLTLWLLGLATAALALVALGSRRDKLQWAFLLSAIVLAVFSGATLLKLPVGQTMDDNHAIPFQPVCVAGELEVCVHPAYEAILPDVYATLASVAKPLLGIQDVPSRAVQGIHERLLPDGTMIYQVYDASQLFTPAFAVARMLVWGEKAYDYENPPDIQLEIDSAQGVIFEWLLGQAGSPRYPFFASSPDARAALDRFAGIGTGDQRRWLSEHYVALRKGNLTLEDLP